MNRNSTHVAVDAVALSPRILPNPPESPYALHMPDVTSSIVISHPVTIVWDYISRPENLYTIIPGVVSATSAKQPPYELGDLWHGVNRTFGITDEWTGTFTHLDPPNGMEFKLTEARVPVTTRDTLEAVSGGTRYTLRIYGDPPFGGALGRLADALNSALFQWLLNRNFAKLPSCVDAWAADNS